MEIERKLSMGDHLPSREIFSLLERLMLKKVMGRTGRWKLKKKEQTKNSTALTNALTDAPNISDSRVQNHGLRKAPEIMRARFSYSRAWKYEEVEDQRQQ